MSTVADQARRATGPKRWLVWAGWLVGAMGLLVLLSSVRWKLTHDPWYVAEWGRLGYSLGALRIIGLVQLTCVVLYLIPRTAVLGTVLLTGYLGGAIYVHVRAGSPMFSHTLFGVYLGLLIWGGLWLRDERLRSLFPFRHD